MDLGMWTWASFANEPAALDMHLVVHAYITDGSTGNVRGTLLNTYSEVTGVNNESSPLHGILGMQFLAPVGVTPVTAQAGDYLVVEFGFVMWSEPASSANITQYGTRDDSGNVLPDLVAGDVYHGTPGHPAALDRATWFEFASTPTPPPVPTCSGGVVSIVDDPPPGPTFEGVGPHEDRVFIETDINANTLRWALQIPMRDAGDAPLHPGFKDGRIVSISSVIRRTTGRLGGWQSSTCRWTADDTSREIRQSIKVNQWYGSEFRAYLAKRSETEDAGMLGRFFVSNYPPQHEFLVDVEGLDLIGSEFSLLSLQRDILGSVLFDTDHFDSLPLALAELNPPQPVPVYMGRWSDEASSADPPVLAGSLARGSAQPTDGSQFIVGYGNMPTGSPPPPDSVTATAVGGGSMNLGVTPHDRMFVLVWAETGGQEGDPFPFYATLLPVTISADGSAIQVDWTFSGSDPDHWRACLAVDYFGPRYDQILQVAGSARTLTFTNVRWGGAGGVTVGATEPYLNRREFAVSAIMLDGRTAACNPIGVQFYGGPYHRPAHVSWLPVAGALSYELYTATVSHLYFGWADMIPVSASAIDSDGYAYYDYNYGQVGTPLENHKLPTPKGMLPVWDTGDEDISGTMHARFVVARWPFHQWIAIRQNGKDITASCKYPDGTWPFPDRFRTFGGCDMSVFYIPATNPIVTNFRDGTAPIYVSACTTEDIGNGLGSTFIDASDCVQHLMTELVINDHLTGTWAGIPLWDDGVPWIRSSDYAKSKIMQTGRIGRPYQARIALDKPTPLGTFVQNVVQSFGLHHGIGNHGQVRAGHYDDVIDMALSYPHYRDVENIKGPIRVVPRTDELENWIPFQANYTPIEKTFALLRQLVKDDTAIAANHGKPKKGQVRSLPYTEDAACIADVMQRALLLGRYVQTWVEVPTDLSGLSVDVFSVIRVTDAEGLGQSGFQEEFILILEHEVKPGDPSAGRPTVVILKGLNISALADAGWVWGPETITDWDSMSDTEKALYGAWAAEDDTIPTANDPAKEFR
jgi:hypothetical protein